MKRLCGSGVMGQSELPRGEVGKGGRPAGRGFGCLKLLLSEKSDWDSAAAPSKGERAVRSDTLMGTTRLGLVKPGGGEGESLVGIWGGGDGRAQSKIGRHGCRSKLALVSMKLMEHRMSCFCTCFKVSPFTIPIDSGGLSLGLQTDQIHIPDEYATKYLA